MSHCLNCRAPVPTHTSSGDRVDYCSEECHEAGERETDQGRAARWLKHGYCCKAVAMLLLASGCAEHVEQTEPTVTSEPSAPVVRISTALSAEHQAAAEFAVESWQAQGLELTFEYAAPELANFGPGNCMTAGALGCAWPGERVVLDEAELSSCRLVRIDGITRCAYADPRWTALHELTHWLGLDHHLPDGNLMQASQPVPSPEPVLTAADIAAVMGAL